jgi:hypothetical protein
VGHAIHPCSQRASRLIALEAAPERHVDFLNQVAPLLGVGFMSPTETLQRRAVRAGGVLVKHVLLRSHVKVVAGACAVLHASLIWNDLLSSPDSLDGGLAIASKCQLARIGAPHHVADAVSRGAARRRPQGREALDAVSVAWYFDASVRGPRRRRTLEGASTTSHADIRWLPRSPTAEHT